MPKFDGTDPNYPLSKTPDHGLRQPKKRPKVHLPARAAAVLPSKVSLRSFYQPPFAQGPYPVCWANAFAAVGMFLFKKFTTPTPPPTVPSIPQLFDGDFFGVTTVGTPVVKVYTIKNVGGQTLLLGGVSLPAGFSLASGLGSTSLAPGASTTFAVRLDATTAGTYTGTMSLGVYYSTITGVVRDKQTSQIVDDRDSGFSVSGSWVKYWDLGQGYRDGLFFAAAGDGSAVATWTFNVLSPGSYEVWASWSPHPNRATNAPYRIYDGTALVAEVRVNQEIASSPYSWQKLGTFNLPTGKLKVTLSNDANEYVIADAVYAGPVGADPPHNPLIQVPARAALVAWSGMGGMSMKDLLEGTGHMPDGSPAGGFADEALWPYDMAHMGVWPTPNVVANAAKHVMVGWGYVGPGGAASLDDMKACLASERPFYFDLPVFGDLQTHVTWPPPWGSLSGYHAGMAVGYDDSTQEFEWWNPWGSTWGENGFGYLPYDWMQNKGQITTCYEQQTASGIKYQF